MQFKGADAIFHYTQSTAAKRGGETSQTTLDRSGNGAPRCGLCTFVVHLFVFAIDALTPSSMQRNTRRLAVSQRITSPKRAGRFETATAPLSAHKLQPYKYVSPNDSPPALRAQFGLGGFRVHCSTRRGCRAAQLVGGRAHPRHSCIYAGQEGGDRRQSATSRRPGSTSPSWTGESGC